MASTEAGWQVVVHEECAACFPTSLSPDRPVEYSIYPTLQDTSPDAFTRNVLDELLIELLNLA